LYAIAGSEAINTLLAIVKLNPVVYPTDMKPPVQRIEIETSTIIRILLLIVAAMAAVWLITRVEHELVWIGVAFFLAVALDPAVSGIAKLLHCGRLLATSIVSIIFILVLGFLGASLVPPLISQSEALVRELPRYLQNAENSHSSFGQLVQHYNLVARLKAQQAHLLDEITSSTGAALGVVRNVFNGLTAVIAILFMTFFMLLEGPRWVAWSGRQVPSAEQRHYHRLTAKMYRIVSGYMTGNLIIAVLIAVVTAVIIQLVGVPYAIPLGLLTGLVSLIPMIGGLLGMVVVCGVAAFTSLGATIALLIYFAIYLVVDAHVLRPVVYSRTVDMSSLLVVIAIVLGVALDGIIGALVAIPLMACIGVLVSDLLGLDNSMSSRSAAVGPAAKKADK
jgi:predicted PurR-regulated permease PerM